MSTADKLQLADDLTHHEGERYLARLNQMGVPTADLRLVDARNILALVRMTRAELATGKTPTNAEIADALGISTVTVQNIKNSEYRKFVVQLVLADYLSDESKIDTAHLMTFDINRLYPIALKNMLKIAAGKTAAEYREQTSAFSALNNNPVVKDYLQFVMASSNKDEGPGKYLESLSKPVVYQLDKLQEPAPSLPRLTEPSLDLEAIALGVYASPKILANTSPTETDLSPVASPAEVCPTPSASPG